MSLAMAHFAFGAAATMVVLTFLLPRLPYPRTLSVFGGVWAMVPDASHVSPVFGEFLRSVHASPYVNLFWAHGVLDALDPGDTNEAAALGVGVLLVATVVAESAEYYFGTSVQRTLSETRAGTSLSALGGSDRSGRADDRRGRRGFGRRGRTRLSLGRVVGLLAGALAVVGGVGLHAVALRTTEFTGLLVGLGALLELVGAATVAEDPAVAEWTAEHVPSWLSFGATAGVVVAACLLAVPLLLALSTPSALSAADAAVGALLVLVAVRLRR